MQRRDFVLTLLAGLPSALPAPSARTRRRRVVHHARPAPGPLDRVCVSSRSFGSYFEAIPGGAVTSPSERLVLLDFPQIVADRYKVHNLEFEAAQFASLDPVYQQALRTNLVAARSRVINIAVDVKEVTAGGGLSDPAASVRNAAINAATPWIDIARRLGARSMSCTPGAIDPDDLSPVIDSYRALAVYGRRRNVAVLIENGGADSEALVQIVREVGGPFIGTLPDFGEFPGNAERLRGLRLLFGYARTICYASQPQLETGNDQPDFDFQECMQISKDAGFRGAYCIEHGGGADAYAKVQSAADALVRFL